MEGVRGGGGPKRGTLEMGLEGYFFFCLFVICNKEVSLCSQARCGGLKGISGSR